MVAVPCLTRSVSLGLHRLILTFVGSKYRFWEWTDYELFSTGTKYILACMTILTIVNVRFLDWRWVVEWTGFLALLIEAMLPLPQFIRNSRSRSVEGLR